MRLLDDSLGVKRGPACQRKRRKMSWPGLRIHQMARSSGMPRTMTTIAQVFVRAIRSAAADDLGTSAVSITETP